MKLSVVIALLGLSAFSLYGSSVSVQKHKQIADNDLDCIAFINNTMFLAGEDEKVYTSEDMGVTWLEKEMKRVNGSIKVILQTTDGTAILAGGTYDENFIMVSTDKGVTWKRMWEDGDMQIRTLFELKNGAVVGIGDENKYAVSSLDYTKWKLMDRPWKKTDKEFTEIDINDSYRFANGEVLMVGESGFSMAYDKMLEQKIFSSGAFNEDVNYSDMYFIDDANGLVASEQGMIYRTDDGGRTWKTVHIGSKHLSGIVFNQQGVGVAVGHEGVLFVSADKGMTWTKAESTVTENLNSVIELKDGKFYAVGDDGVLITISVQ